MEGDSAALKAAFSAIHFAVFDRVRSKVEGRIFEVPQGSILGPFLSSFLINFIGLQLERSRVYLYADSRIKSAAGKFSTAVAGKQTHDLAMLENFFIHDSLIVKLKI